MIRIDADAKPLRNIPVYKRVSDRKPVITALELVQRGDRAPDPALYWFDVRRDVYLLKEIHPEPAPVLRTGVFWLAPGLMITPEDVAKAAQYPIVQKVI